MIQNLILSNELPYGMDKEYLRTIKPSGILRTWMQSKSTTQGVRSDVTHEFLLNMQLSNSENIGTAAATLQIPEGDNHSANVLWKGNEIAFVFSKLGSSTSPTILPGDEIR